MIQNSTTGEVWRSPTTPPDGMTVAPVSLTALGVLFTIDTTGYKSVIVQVTSPGTTCTITYEQSTDSVNWVPCVVTPVNGGNTATTSNTVNIFVAQALAKYFRARVSTYTSGTVTAEANLRNIETPPSANIAGQVNSIPLPIANTSVSRLSMARVMSAASTNATSVKASVGNIYGWSFANTTASAKYVKLYNKASAPTVGTDVPVLTIMVPANGRADLMLSAIGNNFLNGIAYAITGAAADSDATAVAVNDVVGALFYF